MNDTQRRLCDLFGEPLPQRQRFLLEYEVRETCAVGRAIIDALDAADAKRRLVASLRSEDEEFWAFCDGPTVDVTSCERRAR